MWSSDVSQDTLARFGGDDGASEVGPGPVVRRSRVQDPEPRSLLGNEPLRQGVGPLPQDVHRPLSFCIGGGHHVTVRRWEAGWK